MDGVAVVPVVARVLAAVAALVVVLVAEVERAPVVVATITEAVGVAATATMAAAAGAGDGPSGHGPTAMRMCGATCIARSIRAGGTRSVRRLADHIPVGTSPRDADRSDTGGYSADPVGPDG
jgi:hypothetical protein